MRHLRAWGRLLGLGALSLLCAGGVLFTHLTSRAGSERRKRGHARWVGRWARWVFRLIGVHVTAEGTPPTRPHVLVSNHLSYLDILALWNFAEGLFVSKAQVARWPFFGRLTQIGGTIFIDRTKKSDLPRVRALANKRLDEGWGLIFFPEGTSTPGYDLLPFKPGLFSLVLDSGKPVHVASICYATPAGSPPASEAVCWWGDMEFFPHLYRLLQIPRIEARVRFHPEPVPAAHRKELATAARDRCAEIFERVEGSQPFEWKGPDTP
jgi:1-acyl-sn-glycerol-3-phosphate acyltransferase